MPLLQTALNPLSALLAIDTVWLESAPADPAQATANASSSGGSSGGWYVVIAGLVVVLVCLLATRFILRRSRTTALQAAFSKLSMRMMLPRKSRAVVQTLSDASGVPAAAMLVSKGAFTTALANADTENKPAVRAAALKAMHRVFAECKPLPPRGRFSLRRSHRKPAPK